MIKAIIFDYGGVLCYHPSDEQVAELAALCRLPVEDFQKAYWSLRPAYDSGDLTPREYWGRTGDYTESEIETFRDRDVQFWVRLDTRMMDWARELRRAGFRTGLLSNLPPDLGCYLREVSLVTANFDHHSFSYELRSSKPAPAIYWDALTGLGVQPEEALFLDDRADNVAGAVACGMHALQFESPQKLKLQLAQLSGRTGSLMPVGTPPVILE